MCALLIGLVLTASPAQPDELTAARELFFRGQYQEALALLDSLQERELPAEDQIEALELRAFIFFLLRLYPDAERTWRDVLELDPEHRLDPMDTSPDLLAFFGAIRPDQPTVSPEPAPEPTPEPTAEPAVQIDPERGCGVALCLVPFGVGQFANSRPFKGGIFAGLEALFLAVNLGLYWSLEAEYDRHGGFPDPKAADRKWVAQQVFFGLFASTVVAGVVDAFLFP